MDQQAAFTCAESFGDFDLGDGFESEVDVAAGAATMSACVILRLGGASLLPANLGFDTQWIAGNFNPATLDGWSVRLGAYLGAVYGILVETAAGLAAYPVDDGAVNDNRRPYGGKLLVVHLTADPVGGFLVYFNAVPQGLVATANPVAPNAGGRLSIGARSDGIALGLQPFGSSNDFPSQYNGVAGVSYGSFFMSQEDVAAHFRQILDGADLVDGYDAAGDPLGWSNLWSARRGFLPSDPGLATWEDSIGADPLSRFQVGLQTPAVTTKARNARFW